MVKKKKGKKKPASKSCCSHEKKYKEMPYDEKILELVRCGILQDLEALTESSASFNGFVGEVGLIGAENNSLQDPSLADVRNFAIEFGVLPFGCPDVREKFGFQPSILFYGPTGSGKTMLSRAIANSCGARWFDLSPSRISDTGIAHSKSDLEMLVHLTFDIAKYLSPSVIYIDEIERLFEGGKQTGAHPSLMLDTLKSHVKKKITTNNRILVIGNTSKPFLANEKKAFKSLFTNGAEGKEFRCMCFCPYPDYYNRILLWKNFMKKYFDKYEIDIIEVQTKGLDLETLAKCSEGYTSGCIQQAVHETLSYRRMQKFLQLDKMFILEEFINNLSKTEYTFAEDYQNFKNFTIEITCHEEAVKAIEAKKAALENGDAPDPKKKGKKKGGKK